MTPLLELDGIGLAWRQRGRVQPVLTDVSFRLRPGEVVGLIGESGSGKTTLARVILGMVAPDVGAMRFDGGNRIGLSARAIRDFRRSGAIQYVAQDPLGSLDPGWTAGQSIAEPLRIRGTHPAQIPAAVARACTHAGLPADLLDRRPHALSGGQRQRVVIARALVCEPRLLVADEPVSALDASVRARVLDYFAQLRGQLSVAQIFISHDLGSVASLVDRILVLYRGRIVEDGPTAQVIGAPQHAYTRALLAAAPRLRHVAP